MKKIIKLSSLFVILVFTACAHGKPSEYFSGDGIFLNGIDPVSYSQSSGPVLGISQWSSKLGDTTVRFKSAKNKAIFEKNPQKYTPAYNGYCAYAMAEGQLYQVNPRNFKIIDGKTHLFYENLLVDTKKKWNKDEKALKAKADRQWARRGNK